MITNKLHAAKLSAALAIALAAAAGPAAALGLGQIEVKSRLDQPLVAEIPVISGNPAELEQLQARLASPETFRRIGLEPPQGVTADLQFSVALDSRGRPVIRVTSALPVAQPLVSFLVEVDWGQGRLVREYSALLDTPRTVSAPAQPPIQAPLVAPAQTIVRPVEAPVAAAPVPVPEPEPVPEAVPTPEPLPEPESAPQPVAVAPAPEPLPEPLPVLPPEPTPSVAAPVEIAAAPVAVAEAPAPVASEYGPVKSGQTLSQIASEFEVARAYTLDQTMLAVLRANPDAFFGDDINRLKQGAVLRVPQPDEVSRYSAAEAAAVVREQMARWREARKPQPQPAAVVASATDATAAAKPGAAADPRVTGARLEIVPPSKGAAKTGTRSGASAGGEGEMLRQQLHQTKEDLAARNAEVEELKSRVADLEQLQQQQQQLIGLKDSELAAAEQRLATAREAAATTAAAQPAPEPQGAGAASMPWLWGGAGLLTLGLLAWLVARGRRSKQAAPRRGYDTAALAAGMPGVATSEAAAQAPAKTETAGFVADVAAEADLPQWTAPATAAPTWHAGTATAGASAVAEAAVASDPAQQLDLARAYLDLGDDDSARSVLRAVLDSRDPAARTEAARMLRDL